MQKCREWTERSKSKSYSDERIYEILSSQFDPFILFSLHPSWHIPETNAEGKNSKSFDEAKINLKYRLWQRKCGRLCCWWWRRAIKLILRKFRISRLLFSFLLRVSTVAESHSHARVAHKNTSSVLMYGRERGRGSGRENCRNVKTPPECLNASLNGQSVKERGKGKGNARMNHNTFCILLQRGGSKRVCTGENSQRPWLPRGCLCFEDFSALFF